MCKVTSEIMLRLNSLMASARWHILPPALFQWLVAWSLRYTPVHIASRLIRLLLMVNVALCLVAVPLAQIMIYRSLAGTNDLRQNGYFLTVFFAEHIISLMIILLSVSKRAGSV